MTRYICLNFLFCSEIIYLCSGSSDSTTKTWYLFLDDTLLTLKKFQFPSLVAAHQAEVSGPPLGRGPQVENRCAVITLYVLQRRVNWILHQHLPVLAVSCNSSLLEEYLFVSQNPSIILPVLKLNGLDQCDPSNYRPIASVTF